MAPDGSVLLHAVPECPRSYYLSYITKRGWPLLPSFSAKIQRFFEGGKYLKKIGFMNFYSVSLFFFVIPVHN